MLITGSTDVRQPLRLRPPMRENRRRKDYGKSHNFVAVVLFFLYFVVLFYFLFFSESMGRNYADRTYHYNLVPFREIRRFIQYAQTLGMQAVLLNLVGNVLAFLPFGTFLPLFSKRCRAGAFTVLYSFELSLVVELLQLVTKVGSFDVDDLLLNTLGGLLGFVVYCAAVRCYASFCGKRNQTTDRYRGWYEKNTAQESI
jgi:glycopeptide antibiotics resistance protein